jgi:hypothetical protein
MTTQNPFDDDAPRPNAAPPRGSGTDRGGTRNTTPST